MRSIGKYIVACCVLITSAMFATPLLAFDYCQFDGFPIFEPPYPQAKDVVTFDIGLIDIAGPGPVLSKTTVATGSITIDVILTSSANFEMFPDYQSYPS